MWWKGCVAIISLCMWATACAATPGGGGGGGGGGGTHPDTTTTDISSSSGFGAAEGKWDIAFTNFGYGTGKATFAANVADVELINLDENTADPTAGNQCFIFQDRLNVHVEMQNGAANGSLIRTIKNNGNCGKIPKDYSVKLTFTLTRTVPGSSDFGVASGSWTWAATTAVSAQDQYNYKPGEMVCDLAVDGKKSTGCPTLPGKFSTELVGTIMTGSLGTNGKFSAQRQ